MLVVARYYWCLFLGGEDPLEVLVGCAQDAAVVKLSSCTATAPSSRIYIVLLVCLLVADRACGSYADVV